MTVLQPSRPVNDPFIALETKLGKWVFPIQVALVATINIFPSIGDIDGLELKDFWLAQDVVSMGHIKFHSDRKRNQDPLIPKAQQPLINITSKSKVLAHVIAIATNLHQKLQILHFLIIKELIGSYFSFSSPWDENDNKTTIPSLLKYRVDTS